MLQFSLARISSNSGNTRTKSYLTIKWKHYPTSIVVQGAQVGLTNRKLELKYGYDRGVIKSGTSPSEKRYLLGELMIFLFGCLCVLRFERFPFARACESKEGLFSSFKRFWYQRSRICSCWALLSPAWNTLASLVPESTKRIMVNKVHHSGHPHMGFHIFTSSSSSSCKHNCIETLLLNTLITSFDTLHLSAEFLCC